MTAVLPAIARAAGGVAQAAGGIAHAVGAVAGGLADLLLPAVCRVCDSPHPAEGGLCVSCNIRLLGLAAIPYCPRCGSSAPAGSSPRIDGCPACPATLPRFARVVRLGPYADPLRNVIRDLKYRRRERMLRRLGRMLAQAVASQCRDEEFDLVLPVPMHWRRRLARGYDHARVLAGVAAAELDLVVGNELIRVRHTPPQAQLSRTRRIENVRGAFAVSPARRVEGARILLIDDVTTTGATANEAARTLLQAGSLRVTLAVIAKAEPRSAYTDQILQDV